MDWSRDKQAQVWDRRHRNGWRIQYIEENKWPKSQHDSRHWWINRVGIIKNILFYMETKTFYLGKMKICFSRETQLFLSLSITPPASREGQGILGHMYVLVSWEEFFSIIAIVCFHQISNKLGTANWGFHVCMQSFFTTHSRNPPNLRTQMSKSHSQRGVQRVTVLISKKLPGMYVQIP